MKKMKSTLLLSTTVLATGIAGGAFAQQNNQIIEEMVVPQALGGARIPITQNGDNLGNHIATENLVMDSNEINGVGDLRMSGSLMGPLFITMDSGGRITGLALAPTQNSEAASKWYVDQAVRGAADNLGNHAATTELNMRFYAVKNMAHANLMIDRDGVNVKTLKDYVRNNGDNLGDHVATTDILVSGFDIDMAGRDDDGNVVPGTDGRITNVAEPTDDGDAANKKYVDDQIDNIGGGTGGNGMSDIEGGDGIAEIDNSSNPIVINVDDSVVRTDREISGGDGIDGGGTLAGDLTFDLDDTVVRTFGDQTVGGEKTFTDNTRVLQKLEVGTFNGSTGTGISIRRDGQENRIITDSGAPMRIGSLEGNPNEGSFLKLNGPGLGSNDEAKLRSPQIVVDAPDYYEILGDSGKSRIQSNEWGTIIHHLDDQVKIAAGDWENDPEGSSYIQIKPDGTTNFSTEPNMTNHKITMLADPVDPQDAVNLRTLEDAMAGGGTPVGDNLGDHNATERLEMNENTIRVGDFGLDFESFTARGNRDGSGMIIGHRTRDGANVIAGHRDEKLIFGTPDGRFDAGARLEINHELWDGTNKNVMLHSDQSTKISGSTLARVYSDTEVVLDTWNGSSGTFMLLRDGQMRTNARFYMEGQRISEVGDPTDGRDAVNLRTMQAAMAGAIAGVPTGDNLGNHTATQTINASNNKIVGLADADLGTMTDAVNVRTLMSAVSGVSGNMPSVSAGAGIDITTAGNVSTIALDTSQVVMASGDQTVAGVKTFNSPVTSFRRPNTGSSTLSIQPGSSGNGNAYLRGPSGNGILTMAEGNTSLVAGTMVPDFRRVTAGTGLTGGGPLSSDAVLSVDSSVVRSGVSQVTGGDKTWTGETVMTNNRTGKTSLRTINTGAGGLAFFCEDTRSAAGCGGNRAWTNHSDERLKTDITDLEAERGLEAIRALRPVTYLWKEEGLNQDGKKALGLIAQNVEEQFPEVVHQSGLPRTVDGEEVTDIKTMSYAELVAPLILSVQQLDARDMEASARIEELSSELAAMEARLSALEASAN